MRYPFMTLNDGTEITYSSPIQNGDTIQVCVDIETPVENGFQVGKLYSARLPVAE